MTNLSAYLEEAMKKYIGGKWVETAKTTEPFKLLSSRKSCQDSIVYKNQNITEYCAVSDI